MPRKKKVTENLKTVVETEVTENRQAEASLEEASLDDLKVEEKETANTEPKQRKPRAKRGTIKKEAAEKETTGKRGTAKKEAAKKEDVQEKQIFVQYAGNEVTVASIEESVKKAWEAEGHRASSIKKLDIYIKPEESAAYYVINGKNAGRVSF